MKHGKRCCQLVLCLLTICRVRHEEDLVRQFTGPQPLSKILLGRLGRRDIDLGLHPRIMPIAHIPVAARIVVYRDLWKPRGNRLQKPAGIRLIHDRTGQCHALAGQHQSAAVTDDGNPDAQSVRDRVNSLRHPGRYQHKGNLPGQQITDCLPSALRDLARRCQEGPIDIRKYDFCHACHSYAIL